MNELMELLQKDFEGIPYIRFVISWYNSKVNAKTDKNDRLPCLIFRKVTGYRSMVEWLMTLTINGKQMDESIAKEIADITDYGKFELESSSYKFMMNKLNEESE